jgi:hypothetical protein
MHTDHRDLHACAYTALSYATILQAFEGPQFDLSVRLPFVLNTLAITMVLSPALPLLIPIATVAFAVTYYVSIVQSKNYISCTSRMHATVLLR